MTTEIVPHQIAQSSRSCEISPLELSLEDAGRLGKCFESWDDSDSWPGGWTQGVPQTAERVLEDLKKSTPLRRMVARDGDKIVGYCVVLSDLRDKDAVYVGLLGVSPGHQGLGYGKALLLDATEFAISLGKMRITLGTWGGNLKGMPLYKRQGYFWVPNTSVFMENYIPGVISCPYFREFFARFEWYSSFQRQILQKPDDTTTDGLGIYEYYFVGDEENELRVWIDREGKGIIGFQWTKDGHDHSLRCSLSSQQAYLGFENVALGLKFENKLNEPLKIQLKAEGTEGVLVSDIPDSVLIESDHTKTINGRLSVSPTAPETDREKEKQTKAKTRLITDLTINGKSLTLTCGLLARRPVSLHLFPSFLSLRPNCSNDLPMNIKNNTTRSLEVVTDLKLALANGKTVPLFSKTLNLAQKSEKFIKLDLDLAEITDSQVAQLSADLCVINGDSIIDLPKDSIPVPIIGEAGILAYRLKQDAIVLENTTIRLILSGIAPHGIHSITNKIEKIQLMECNWGDDIGLPYQGYFNEFTTKEYDVQLETKEGHFARLLLKTDSKKKSGLQLARIITLPPNSASFSVHYEFHNPSDQKIADVAFALRPGWWPFSLWDGKLFLPLKQGLKVHDRVEWTSDKETPSKASEFTEEWIAIESQDRWVLGMIWDEHYATKIITARPGFPGIEIKVPDLNPGESHKSSRIIAYIGPGSWKTVRNMWMERYRSIGNQIDPLQDLQVPVESSTVETTLVSADQPKDIPFAVFRPGEESLVELQVENISRRLQVGQISAQFPSNSSSEGITDWKLPEIKETVWKGHLPINLGRNGIFEIYTELKTNDFQQKNVFSIISADVDDFVEIESSPKENGFSLFTIKNGYLEFSASPEFCAAITSLRRINSRSNLLLSRFPILSEYAWYNIAPLGIHGTVLGINEWNADTTFRKETFTGGPAQDGSWQGVEFKTQLQVSPITAGLEVTLKYMTFPQAPLIRVTLCLFNPTNRAIEFNSFISLFSALQDGKTFHYSRDSRIQKHISSDKSTPLTIIENWIAIEFPETGEFLGVIQSPTLRGRLVMFDGGEKFDTVETDHNFGLLPGSTVSLDLYLVLAESVDQIINIARSFLT